MDLTGNNHAYSLCKDWLDAKKKLAKYKKIEEEAKNSLINLLNKNQTNFIICGNYEIHKKTIKGSAGKEITFEDLGKIVGSRKESTTITINEIED